MGAPCLGGGGGSWFYNGFPWFGFWFWFGLRRAGNLHHSLNIRIPLPSNCSRRHCLLENRKKVIAWRGFTKMGPNIFVEDT